MWCRHVEGFVGRTRVMEFVFCFLIIGGDWGRKERQKKRLKKVCAFYYITLFSLYPHLLHKLAATLFISCAPQSSAYV